MAKQYQFDWCAEHNFPITALYIGQQQRRRLLCDQCEQCEPKIPLEKGLEKFEGLSSQAKYIQKYKEDEFNQIVQETNPLIERHKQNIGLFEQLIDIVQDSLIKIDSETEFLCYKSQGTLDLAEINHLAVLLMKQKNGIRNSYEQISNKFSKIFENIFQKVVQANKDVVDYLNYFKEKIIKFINNLRQEELLLESQNFVNEGFKNLQLSANNRILVSSIENSLHTFSIKNYQIKKNQIILTEHNKITAICFDNENRIYITGQDKIISHWELSDNKHIFKYKFDTFFKDPINQMLFDQKNRQLITSTNGQIITWLDKEQKQVLKTENNNSSSLINCMALNKLCSLLLSGGQQLVIWDRTYHGWVACQTIRKKVNSVCFLDESQQQFISLSCDEILLWKLQGQKFVQMQSIASIQGQLIFCQSQKLIVCFNKSQCNFFKLEQNELIHMKSRRGEGMNVCAFENGEQIILLNYGLCIILQTKFFLLDS